MVVLQAMRQLLAVHIGMENSNLIVIEINTHIYNYCKFMRTTNKLGILKYESPQIQILMFEFEQCIASSTMLDDMTESEGTWDF